ncbi:DUF6318 family protein [Mumia zhuanghuii]|uniref:DUF6318 family protein n=1 Tax=Mumia zhuanghuii TaxID=2585211 RepID=UPI0036443650
MTRLGTALAAAVALLSVTACTGEEPADGDPTSAPPTTASASPSPTPSAPTIPPEATKHSADGAAAFVKYWNEVFNYTVTTLDTRHLDALSAPDCDACGEMIGFVDRVRVGGGYSESPRYRTLVTSSQLIDGAFMVAAEHTSSDYRYRESADSKEMLVRAAKYRYLYELGWNGRGWSLDGIRKQESAS